MKKAVTLSLSALGLMLVAGAALAADPSATTMPGATAVTSDAFAAAGTGETPQAPSGVDLKGYKLVWSDEFNTVSWTDQSPKGSAKWLSKPSVPGKFIGLQVHDNESMTIKDGIMINTLSIKMAGDGEGSRCAGPVGMKDDSGKELISIGKLGAVKRKDARLTWGEDGWVGMKFTTPAAGLSVSQLGRYSVAGSKGTFDVRILDAATGDDVAKAIVNLRGQPAGWVYGPIVGGVKKLAGNHEYYLITPTVYYAGGYKVDPWYDAQTTVTASGGITIQESLWGNWHAGSLFSIDTTGAGFVQQFGYWEARVKMPAGGVGLWPSFCLYTHGKSGLSEEVDIFEEYGGAYDADKDGGFGMRNGNWGRGGEAGHANVWPPVSKPWLNWHVYGFLATPTKCSFYVDGDKKGEYDTPTKYLNAPMYMTLEYNTGGFWPMTNLIANSHMDVDWVRVWALPEGK
jgi:hypothetical protein